MNIVFVCDTLGSGGAERVISTLSNDFVDRGHSVSIIMLSKEAMEPFYKLESKISLSYLTKDVRSDLGFFKKAKLLRKLLVDKKPDIVISFLSYVCIYTWWALRKTRIPYIVSERNDPNQRQFIKQKLLNRAFKKSNGCVFQTEDSAEWYKKIAKNKSVVIYNPVYLDPLLKKPDKIKKQILYVGRFNEQKNLFMLIDAFKLFKKDNPQFILKMYGDGLLKQAVIDYVNKQGVANDVIINGSSDKWQIDECNSSLFVLPSKYEGMPNVLAEALCLGIPSVSTNCPIGGPKELKKIFPKTLVLSDSIEPESFAKAMKEGVKIKGSGVEISNELKIDNIANQWLNFIYKRVNMEKKNVR